MYRKTIKGWWKNVLFLSKVKLLYARITLTRHTTWYFLFALVTSVVLVILQATTFVDNKLAVNIVSDIVQVTNVTLGIPVLVGGQLRICNKISGDVMQCNPISVVQSETKRAFDVALGSGRVGSFGHVNVHLHRRQLSIVSEIGPDGRIGGARINQDTFVDLQCASSLIWVEAVLRDATREDIVTLGFQIWLFILTVVSILNESLPHLAAGLVGHLMALGWAVARVRISLGLTKMYLQLVVNGSCNGIDLLGTWWDQRTTRTIPILVVNAVSLAISAYFSVRLYQVYVKETFKLVNSSPKLAKIYRLILLLSVSLQLAGFLAICSTGVWLDKIIHASVRILTKHIILYLVAFLLLAVLLPPWIYMGWVCVRRERKTRFICFIAISLTLIVISALMFTSLIYRFVFSTWPFFATITVTAFVMLVATLTIALICRCHFNSGLAELLRVPEVPEGADFAPVCVGGDGHKPDGDISDKEKGVFQSGSLRQSEDIKQALELHSAPRFPSIYSDSDRVLKFSVTPRIIQEAFTRPPRLRASILALDSNSVMSRDSVAGSVHAPPMTPPPAPPTEVASRKQKEQDRYSRVPPPPPSLKPPSTPLPAVPSFRPLTKSQSPPRDITQDRMRASPPGLPTLPRPS